MSTSSLEFSAPRFLEDLAKGSEDIGGVYSEETTKKVLEAYGNHFNEGAVQVRASSRHGKSIAYRLYTHKPIKAVEIGVEAGLLKADNVLVPLLYAWRDLCEGAYEQADFQADIGLTRAFLYLGGVYPLDKIIDAPFVPDTIKQNKAALLDCGLEPVQVVEPDFHNKTVSFYIIASGPLTRPQADKLCALAGAPPPTDFTFDEMSILLGKGDFFVNVTMDLESGNITRVDFYILFPIELPGGRLPEVGPLLTTFWDVPSYEDEVMDILCWSFGKDCGSYINAERGYSGGLRGILRDWKIMTVE